MKKSILIVLFLLVIPIQSHADPFDDWTKEDYTLQAASTVLHIADWLQTRDIATRDDFIEINPILGNNPSIGEVNTYFATTLIASWIVADLLSPKYRTYFQCIYIGVEAKCVYSNYSAGIKFKF